MEVNSLHVLVILHLVACTTSHTILKLLKHCNTSTDYDYLFNVSITTTEDKQYVNGGAILKVPFDNTVRAHVSVNILTGKTFMHILDINEKKGCDAFHKYFGEFAYELERKAQAIPGMCPIPTGKYFVHNFYVDFEKIITLVNFPFGYLRFIFSTYNNNNKLLSCLNIEIQNQL